MFTNISLNIMIRICQNGSVARRPPASEEGEDILTTSDEKKDPTHVERLQKEHCSH